MIQKVRNIRQLTNYGIMKALRALGIEVTTQGVDSYEKPTARSMRLDVLCGLRRIYGKNWNEFGKILDEEFGPRGE